MWIDESCEWFLSSSFLTLTSVAHYNLSNSCIIYHISLLFHYLPFLLQNLNLYLSEMFILHIGM